MTTQPSIAEQLRAVADSYERAHQTPGHYNRIRALREARGELFRAVNAARYELDQQVLASPARHRPPAARHIWWEIVPDPAVVAYWRSFNLKLQTVTTLARLGIKDLDALEQLNAERLIRTTFIGKNMLREIEDVLLDSGKVFRGKGFAPLEPPAELVEQALARSRRGAAE